MVAKGKVIHKGGVAEQRVLLLTAASTCVLATRTTTVCVLGKVLLCLFRSLIINIWSSGGSCRRGKSGFMGLSPGRNNACTLIQKNPLENRIIHVLSMLHLHTYVCYVVRRGAKTTTQITFVSVPILMIDAISSGTGSITRVLFDQSSECTLLPMA